MKIIINGDGNLSYYTYLLNKIVLILKSLFESECFISIFSKKIENSEIIIEENNFITNANMDVYEFYKSNFKYFINKNDSICNIVFTLSHELTHLAFSAKDEGPLLDFCSSDGSYSMNAITRYCFDDGNVYGSGLEELLCNYISKIVCEKLKEDLKLDLSVLEDKEEQFSLIESITNCFNSVDSIGKCLDSLYFSNNTVIPHNRFWYNLTHYNIGTIIYTYDSLMGQYSWKTLNELIEKKFISNDIKPIEAEFLNSEVIRFKIKNGAA